MALKFVDGCDAYNSNAGHNVKWGNYETAPSTSVMTTGNTLGVTGGNSLVIDSDSLLWRAMHWASPVILGVSEALYVAFWFKPTGLPTTDRTTAPGLYANNCFFTCSRDAQSSALNFGNYTTNLTNTNIQLMLVNSGYIRLCRNDTVLTTSAAAAFTNDSWHFVQIKLLTHGTTGVVEVVVNGSTVYSYTGNVLVGTAGLKHVYFSGGYGSGGQGLDGIIDDVMIWTGAGSAPNDYLSSPKVINTSFPNAAGSLTQGTPSTGANYTCVDENPPNGDTDYVSFGTVNNADLYNMADISTTYTGIVAVVTNSIHRQTGAQTRKFKPRIKSSTAVAYGDEANIEVSASFVNAQGIFALDPNTSAAWTPANINSAEFGVELTV